VITCLHLPIVLSDIEQRVVDSRNYYVQLQTTNQNLYF